MIIKDIWKHQLVYPLSKFLWFSYIVPFSEIGIRSLALRLVCFWWHLFARCFLQHVRCEAGNPVFKNMCTMYITMQCPKRFSNQHVFQKGRIPFANLPLTPPPKKKTCSLTSHMWFPPPLQDASQKKQPLLSLSHIWKHILFSVAKNLSSLWWCSVIGWREQPWNLMGNHWFHRGNAPGDSSASPSSSEASEHHVGVSSGLVDVFSEMEHGAN